MNGDTLDIIVARLDGAHSDGNGGFMARCPCHDDHTPSLHLWTDDQGRLAFNCLAGCKWEHVRDALDLAPASSGDWTPHGPATAEYRYTDEHGELLYTVCRTADKQFPCWCPDPTAKNGRRWSIKDVRRVLYRLPGVLAAVNAGEPIYVVEGEKDADALAAAGVAATCNPGGAGKWQPEYSEFLRDALVVIVRDNDDAGHAHAEKVRAALEGVARQVVVVVEAKAGKDAADHLAAGYDVDQFVLVVPEPVTTGLPALTLAELQAQAPERTKWVWFGYVGRGVITDLTAKTKAGKTTLIMQMICSLLRGDEFLTHLVARSRVLMLSEESKSSFLATTRRNRLPSENDAFHVLLRGWVRGRCWEDVCAGVLAYCRLHHIDVVVVDTLTDWAGLRGEEENSAGAALAAVAPLRALADEGIAVLTVRHEGKHSNPPSDLSDLGRGSSAFAGAVDILVNLRKTPGRGHATRRELRTVGRFDETPAAATIDYVDHCYQLVTMSAEGREREVELDLLGQLPTDESSALTEAELRDRLSINHSTAIRALKSLCTRGVIVANKRPRPDGFGQVTVYWHDEGE